MQSETSDLSRLLIITITYRIQNIKGVLQKRKDRAAREVLIMEMRNFNAKGERLKYLSTDWQKHIKTDKISCYSQKE